MASKSSLFEIIRAFIRRCLRFAKKIFTRYSRAQAEASPPAEHKEGLEKYQVETLQGEPLRVVDTSLPIENYPVTDVTSEEVTVVKRQLALMNRPQSDCQLMIKLSNPGVTTTESVASTGSEERTLQKKSSRVSLVMQACERRMSLVSMLSGDAVAPETETVLETKTSGNSLLSLLNASRGTLKEGRFRLLARISEAKISSKPSREAGAGYVSDIT